MTRSSTISLAITAAIVGPLGAQNLAPPPDWTWVLDAAAQRVDSQLSRARPDTVFRFVMMPPGYHITTGPAATLFDPANHADGIYTLESELFLFPDSRDGEFGLFIGGADLETERPRFTAFVARRDGSIAVQRYDGVESTPLVAWARSEALQPPVEGRPAKNVMRVVVEPAAMAFVLNGTEVARVPRDSMAAAGVFGFRLGPGVNLHVTTLDFTRRLAPPRPPQPEADG